MLSDGDATILLNAIILNDRIYKIAMEKLDDPIFDPASQYAHDFLLKQFVDMSAEAGERVSLSMLSARLHDAMEEMGEEEADWAEDIHELYFHISENKEDEISEDYVMDLMQRVANEQVHKSSEQLLNSIMDRESPADFQSKMSEEFNKILSGKQINDDTESSYVQPLLCLEEMMVDSKAWPIGVDFFDEMTGGGVRASKLWGFLAPPAGGKTTLAVQLGVNWVKQSSEHHIVLMLYEQPPEGDITSRILSQVTGENVSLFRDQRMDQLSPDLRAMIMDRSNSYAHRVHVYDFSKPGKGVRGLEDIKDGLDRIGLLRKISDVDTEKIPPVLVIVDWLIPFFQRVMTHEGEGKLAIGNDLRGYGTKLMDEIKAFKNMYHVTIMLNHQLNTKAGVASATRAPAWSDAAEWSGFSWMLDDCFGVGNRTEEDIAIMAASKARATARSQVMVKLDGAYCRFVDVSNSYTVTNGRMVNKSMLNIRGGSSSEKMARGIRNRATGVKTLPTDVSKLKENFTSN